MPASKITTASLGTKNINYLARLLLKKREVKDVLHSY